MKTLTKICLVCGKKFIKPVSCSLADWYGGERRPNGRRFCSRSCGAKYQIQKKGFGTKTRFKKGQKAINPIKKGERKGIKTEFKKGQAPWNKGMKADKEWYEKMERVGFLNTGRFKKKRLAEKAGNWKGGITENKDYWVVANAKRRKLAIKNGGTHTIKEWNDLKEKHNYTCANPFCKKREPETKLVQDHIVSLKKGGSNDIKNIQPFCKSCNSKKHTKSLCEFLAAYKRTLN